ncbi:hypothetical protein AAMO2058_000712400 [Amorphochlora amoebiformis]
MGALVACNNCRTPLLRGPRVNSTNEACESQRTSPSVRAYQILEKLDEELVARHAKILMDFVVEDIKKYGEDHNNIIVSPGSLSAIITMLQLATCGKSRRQLEKAFGPLAKQVTCEIIKEDQKIALGLKKSPRTQDSKLDEKRDRLLKLKQRNIHRERLTKAKGSMATTGSSFTTSRDKADLSTRAKKLVSKLFSTSFAHSVWIPGETCGDWRINTYSAVGGASGNHISGSYHVGKKRKSSTFHTELAFLFEKINATAAKEVSLERFLDINMEIWRNRPEKEFLEFVLELNETATNIRVESESISPEIEECGLDRNRMLLTVFHNIAGMSLKEVDIREFRQAFEQLFQLRRDKGFFSSTAYGRVIDTLILLEEELVNSEDFAKNVFEVATNDQSSGNFVTDEEFQRLAQDLLISARKYRRNKLDRPASLEPESQTRSEMLTVVFDQLDDDSSGTVSLEEFVGQLGQPRTVEVVDWWCEKASYGRIKAIFGHRLRGIYGMACGIAFCKPRWHVRFETKLDRADSESVQYRPDFNYFRLSPTSRVRCKFMHRRWVKTPYLVTPKAYVIYIPMSNSIEGVIIAIPRRKDDFHPPTLDDIIGKNVVDDRTGKTTTEFISLSRLVEYMCDTKRVNKKCVTHVTLPIGIIESTTNHTRALRNWGCGGLLDEGYKNDWKPSFRYEDAIPFGMKLSGITQKSALEFAPEGEFSGAPSDTHVHGLGMALNEKRMHRKRHFIADRPFLCVVQYRGKIVMMANVNIVASKAQNIERNRAYTWGSSCRLGEDFLSDDDEEDYLEFSLQRPKPNAPYRTVKAFTDDLEDSLGNSETKA